MSHDTVLAIGDNRSPKYVIIFLCNYIIKVDQFLERKKNSTVRSRQKIKIGVKKISVNFLENRKGAHVDLNILHNLLYFKQEHFITTVNDYPINDNNNM